MNTPIAVQTTRLCKEFDGSSVLAHLEIAVPQGEIYGILGANGAGKTTLLKLIAGLLEPTEGVAQVLGHNSWQERNQVLRNIGTLIEVPFFYEHLPAHENLSIHLAYMQAQGDIKAALGQVSLGDAGEKAVSKFSLGMRQRLAIARSILHRPKVLLLDEPINGLDPAAIREIRELLLALKADGMTILLSSHILSEVEQVADRVAILENGSLIQVAEMAALKQSHGGNLEDYLIKTMRGGC